MPPEKTIVFSCDHTGVLLKASLIETAENLGWNVIDLGPTDHDSAVDYPDFALKGVHAVLGEKAVYGVLICGTGIGMCMAANRHKGIRAALCHHEYEARAARQHNNANILCLGARVMGVEIARACLDVFLNTSFEGGRHDRRILKLDDCLPS